MSVAGPAAAAADNRAPRRGRARRAAGWLPVPLQADRIDVALVCVAGAALAVAAYYGLAGLQVHRSLHTTAFDLAFFDQILWNTAHGHPLETTYLPYSFFGQHWQPLLLLFVLPYRLGAGPGLLIVAQAAGACAAAIPLFLAGRRLTGSGAAALSVAYLVAPALQHGLDFGFHPELFEPLLAFAALTVLLAGSRWLFIGLVALLLCAKEDACLLGAMLGWLCFLLGERRLGVGVIAASLLWGLAIVGVAMPLLRHGLPSDLTQRYAYLAGGSGGPASVAEGVVRHPDRVLRHVLSRRAAGAFLAQLAAVGFLPLLAPRALIAALPVALVGLLSNYAPQASLTLQYGVPLLTALFLAAVFGLGNLRAALDRRHIAVPARRITAAGFPALAASVAFVGSAGVAFARGPFPGEGGLQTWRFRDSGASALRRVAALIPADAALSAQTGLAPQLAHRRYEWEFPMLERAQYVVLQHGGIVSAQSLPQYDATVAALPGLGFTEIAHSGSITLYRRTEAEP